MINCKICNRICKNNICLGSHITKFHIISKNYGFKNNIPPEKIGDITNLRFIPWRENISKGDKLI